MDGLGIVLILNQVILSSKKGWIERFSSSKDTVGIVDYKFKTTKPSLDQQTTVVRLREGTIEALKTKAAICAPEGSVEAAAEGHPGKRRREYSDADRTIPSDVGKDRKKPCQLEDIAAASSEDALPMPSVTGDKSSTTLPAPSIIELTYQGKIGISNHDFKITEPSTGEQEFANYIIGNETIEELKAKASALSINLYIWAQDAGTINLMLLGESVNNPSVAATTVYMLRTEDNKYVFLKRIA